MINPFTKKYDHWSEVSSKDWFWPNFSPEEMASKGDESLVIDSKSMDKLQALRNVMGRLKINSAYRDKEYNKAIGGAENSQHVLGKAFDIALAGHDPKKLYAEAKKVGFTGFGFYNTFLHVDTGPARAWGAARKKFE